jgi:hypothetical protein
MFSVAGPYTLQAVWNASNSEEIKSAVSSSIMVIGVPVVLIDTFLEARDGKHPPVLQKQGGTALLMYAAAEPSESSWGSNEQSFKTSTHVTIDGKDCVPPSPFWISGELVMCLTPKITRAEFRVKLLIARNGANTSVMLDVEGYPAQVKPVFVSALPCPNDRQCCNRINLTWTSPQSSAGISQYVIEDSEGRIKRTIEAPSSESDVPMWWSTGPDTLDLLWNTRYKFSVKARSEFGLNAEDPVYSATIKTDVICCKSTEKPMENNQVCRCAPGHYQSGFDCSPCGLGEYPPEAEQPSCLGCGVGRTTNATGSRMQSQCECEEDKVPSSSNTSCVCPAGLFKT